MLFLSVRKKSQRKQNILYYELYCILNRSLLDKHRYEWAPVLDFQYAKNKNSTPIKAPNEYYFLKSAFTSIGGEDNSKLFITVKEHIKIQNCLIKKN